MKIRPAPDWTHSNGNHDESLYYEDFLHLSEKGNEKFARSIVEVLNIILKIKTPSRSSPTHNLPLNNKLPTSVRRTTTLPPKTRPKWNGQITSTTFTTTVLLQPNSTPVLKIPPTLTPTNTTYSTLATNTDNITHNYLTTLTNCNINTQSHTNCNTTAHGNITSQNITNAQLTPTAILPPKLTRTQTLPPKVTPTTTLRPTAIIPSTTTLTPKLTLTAAILPKLTPSARSEFWGVASRVPSLQATLPPSPQIFSVISDTSCHTPYLFFKNTNCVTPPQIIFANLGRFPSKLQFPKNFNL